MSHQTIDYPKLVEHALRHVVHDTLTLVAEHGLPGRHNIYITFRTDHPDVAIEDELKERYPSEMTIVLQHEFWGLEVSDHGFGVTLSFNNVSQRLEIPFTAITVFADPSVEFGLQFNLTDQDTDSESESDDQPEEPGEVMEMPVATELVSNEAAAKPQKTGDSADVVALDHFRKKS
ncbi:MAG: SspB family protein [Geminicoccaceae bacterium]